MLSFICGLLTCVLPNISYYKNILLPNAAVGAARLVLKKLYLTEIFKIVMTVSLLSLFLKSKNINSTYFIYGFLLAQLVHCCVLKIMMRFKT